MTEPLPTPPVAAVPESVPHTDDALAAAANFLPTVPARDARDLPDEQRQRVRNPLDLDYTGIDTAARHDNAEGAQ